MSGPETSHDAGGNGNGKPEESFITVPASARKEIGELTFYLEQALRNLREVNDAVIGSSEKMPGVLHDLREIINMTEAATVRVLEETEALVEEGRGVTELIAGMRNATSGAAAESLAKVDAYVAKSTDRAMAIISALEFQDLTTQKVQRAFALLEEVLERLARIRLLVDLGQTTAAPHVPAPSISSTAADAQCGQALADELLQQMKE